MITIGVAIK